MRSGDPATSEESVSIDNMLGKRGRERLIDDRVGGDVAKGTDSRVGEGPRPDVFSYAGYMMSIIAIIIRMKQHTLVVAV